MNCVRFQDSLSDYIEGSLDSRIRAECAAHRLICGECRELYNDVRATVQALNAVGAEDFTEAAEPEGLRNRILSATTTGEMLSCGEFDRLLERYFDGVILAPTFQTFQSHFEKCFKCRRLLNGIEEAIEMCHEVKDAEVEVPNSLHDRIVAATVGRESAGWIGYAQSAIVNFARPLMSPQMAVAAMILAAISLLVTSRFGSVSNLTYQAEEKAGNLVNEGQRKINSTSAMALSGFQRVSYGLNSFLFNSPAAKPEPGRAQPDPARGAVWMQPSPQPRPQHDPGVAPPPAERDKHQKRPRQNGQKQ
ncbi:MAG: anti-sigma factor [Blastocatellales bacterium]